jgi:hypothetical protein
MGTQTGSYSPQKLGELILYVSQKSLGDRHFGKTKLNKILFFSDFAAYRASGSSITGAVYWRLPQGPCPQQLLPVLADLGDDLILLDEVAYGYTKVRPMPRRPADLTLFSGAEIAVVDGILDDYWSMTGSQISAASHETLSWLIAEDGQEIPFGTAFMDAQPTPEDLKWLDGVDRDATVGSASR